MSKLIIALMMLLLVSTTVGAQEFQGKAEYFSKFIFKSKKKLTDETEKVNEDKELKEAVQLAMKKSSEKTYTLLFIKKKPFTRKMRNWNNRRHLPVVFLFLLVCREVEKNISIPKKK